MIKNQLRTQIKKKDPTIILYVVNVLFQSIYLSMQEQEHTYDRCTIFLAFLCDKIFNLSPGRSINFLNFLRNFKGKVID